MLLELSIFGAMWKGLVNNDVDAAFATTITGPAKEAETLPAYERSPPRRHNDKAGCARTQKVGSFFFPHVATCGAGISLREVIALGIDVFPVFVVYGSQSTDQV